MPFLAGRENIVEIVREIQDFDEYDLVIAPHLKNTLSEQAQVPLTKTEYINIRKKEASIALCQRYFNGDILKYKHHVLMLLLVRLYLYSNYPNDSLVNDWGRELQYMEYVTELYEDRLLLFNDFYNDNGGQ
jgi:hypothetical protein